MSRARWHVALLTVSVFIGLKPIGRTARLKMQKRMMPSSNASRRVSGGRNRGLLRPMASAADRLAQRLRYVLAACTACVVDNHFEIDNTGARVHEISAPLAAAGISILYQSSHISDFIFVCGRVLPRIGF